MKKIKLLFLTTLIIMLCTGCTIEYNIDITADNIKEVINVTDHITTYRSQQDILEHYNTWYPTFVNFIKSGESIEIEDYNKKIDGIEYHNKKINKIGNRYEYTYNYTYNIDEYYDSYAIANAFIESTVHNDSTSLVLRTSKENLLCQYDFFDSLKVNITIDPTVYKLNYTNTSNINNNTYTWILDKNSCKNSQIILTLDKQIQEDDANSIIDKADGKYNKKTDQYVLYIFLVEIALIVFIGYKWFTKFKDKNNDID